MTYTTTSYRTGNARRTGYARYTANRSAAPLPATDSQLAYLRTLAAQRVHSFDDTEAPADRDRASYLITTLKACAWRPRDTDAAPRVTLAAGTYRAPDGRIMRVQLSQGSRNAYALVWTPDGGTDARGKITGSFVYTAGAVRGLTPDHALTLADACRFGVATGTCADCGDPLSDNVSIALGIGPTCERKRTGRNRSQAKAYRASVLAAAGMTE